jgi:hypothetical protein
MANSRIGSLVLCPQRQRLQPDPHTPAISEVRLGLAHVPGVGFVDTSR